MQTSRSADVRPVAYPKFIYHESFEEENALEQYDPASAAELSKYADKYMPDEVTRDYAKRMHYAGYRLRRAKGLAEIARWREAYYYLRDQIVVGNRKLIYRAVRRKLMQNNRSDDSIGDCHIVLIQAVAAYNPWLGIRFSTYAYTCLVRALSRQSQRMMKDWLSRSMPLETLPDGDVGMRFDHELYSSSSIRIDDFLKAEHPLLSPREKVVISRRFTGQSNQSSTLERVGMELGLSKERVRQVQASALDKLRRALVDSNTAI